jgi:hypothetical protein
MYKYEYKGCTITIEVDPKPVNPREKDNLGTIVCFYQGQDLGDCHVFDSPAEVVAHIKETKAVSLPIYSELPCPVFNGWDTKQLGVIFSEAYRIYKEFNVKKVSQKVRKQVVDLLTEELHTYDNFLRGDIYRFKIIKKGVEAVKGPKCYYGKDFENNGLLKAARTCVLHLTEGVDKGNSDQIDLFK